jgi:plasmid stability protein
MAQLVVRNLDDRLKERLRRSAAAHGRSMEEEARLILHRALPATALPNEPESHLGLGSKIHALFMDLEVPEEYFTAVDEARGPDTARPRPTEFDG